MLHIYFAVHSFVFNTLFTVENEDRSLSENTDCSFPSLITVVKVRNNSYYEWHKHPYFKLQIKDNKSAVIRYYISCLFYFLRLQMNDV